MDVEITGLLRREVTTLVFDQYGTIVDMQGGLTAAVTSFLAGKGWTGDPHRFVTWWRRTHFEDSMIDSLCNRGPHFVPADRTPRGGERHASCRHRLHPRGGALARRADRAAEAVSRRAGSAGRPSPEVSPRNPVQRRSRHARSRQTPYTGSNSTPASRSRRPAASSPIMQRTRRPASGSASTARACCSSPTTRSTASARRRTGCAPRSSIGASDPSAIRRTSRTSSWRTSRRSRGRWETEGSIAFSARGGADSLPGPGRFGRDVELVSAESAASCVRPPAPRDAPRSARWRRNPRPASGPGSLGAVAV